MGLVETQVKNILLYVTGYALNSKHKRMLGQALMSKPAVRTLQRAAGLLLVLFFFACGRKADPGLPLTIAPQPAERLYAFARDEAVVLVWKFPRQNTNESSLHDLAGCRIFREEVPFEQACLKCPKNFIQIFDYEYRGPRGKTPGREWVLYYDRDITVQNLYTYTIQCYNEKDVPGPYSRKVHIYWDVPPAAPGGFSVSRRYRVVELQWDKTLTLADGTPADNIAGYNVYRAADPGVTEQLPLHEEILIDTWFEDIPEKQDTVYYYSVRAVRAVQGSLIESAASAEIKIVYSDIKPPGIPQALTAIPTADGIVLKWMPKAEQDFAGFNLYRRELPAKEFIRLNEKRISQSSWVDTTARKRKRYIYAVTSVDKSAQANESDFSKPAEVLYIIK